MTNGCKCGPDLVVVVIGFGLKRVQVKSGK